MKFYKPYRQRVYVRFLLGNEKTTHSLVETNGEEVEELLNSLFAGNIERATGGKGKLKNIVRVMTQEYIDRDRGKGGHSFLIHDIDFDRANELFVTAVNEISQRGLPRLNELND